MSAQPARVVRPPEILEGGRLVEAVKHLLATPGDLALDFETNIARAHKRRACVISMTHEAGPALVGRLDWRDDAGWHSPARILLPEMFGEFLGLPPWERPATLVAHNAQFETEVLLAHGVAVDVECSMIAAKCLHLTAVPEGTKQPVEFSLAALVEREFGRARDKTIRERDWSRREALDEEGAAYCLDDARDALELWRLYRDRLRAEGLWRGYLDMARSIRGTASINLAGMAFDGEAHGRLCGRLAREAADVEVDLGRHSRGAVKNHGSTAQVGNWVVEEVLGLDQLTEPKPPKVETLAQFIRQTGKIRADGETRARDLPGSVCDLLGRPHEDATLSAWEAGYLGPRGDMEDRPGPDALLNALADDLNRHLPPVLREEDQADWDLYEAERAAHEATREALAERGLEQRRRLLAAFDMRLRAATGHGWRWAPKTLNLRVDKGAMARMPARLRPRWPRVADYLEARARWTKAGKLLSAFGPNLRKFVDDEDGRVRGQFGVFKAVTGRQSCSDPNLQNQPRDPAFRALWVAPSGRKLVHADYSQIELRLGAIIAKDEHLLDVYREHRDVHAENAAIIYAKDVDDVTKAERQKCKGVGFACLYGAGAAGIAEGCGIEISEAEVFLSRFLSTYRGLARYREEAPREAARLGYIAIERDRRVLYEPSITPATCTINFPVQGGAATVQMLALRKVHDALAGRPDLDAQVVASVHDEFLLEAPDDDRAREAGAILQDCMRAALLEVFPAAVEMGADRLADASVVGTWAEKA